MTWLLAYWLPVLVCIAYYVPQLLKMERPCRDDLLSRALFTLIPVLNIATAMYAAWRLAGLSMDDIERWLDKPLWRRKDR